MDAHLEQQVRERAFQLWETGAVHGGTDLDYWVAAECEVKAKLVAPMAATAKSKKARAKASSKSSAKTKN